jgi:hypothetical protein
MPDVEVEVSEDLVDELEATMRIVDALFERQRNAYLAQLGVVEMLVGTVQGRLKVHLQFNEHPPPHFSVRHPEGVARFRVDNGERLEPDRALAKYDGVIKAWQKKNRRKLAIEWNSSRPSGCTAGLVDVPDEDKKA